MRGVVKPGGTPFAPTLLIRQGAGRTAATWILFALLVGAVVGVRVIHPYRFDPNMSNWALIPLGVGALAIVILKLMGPSSGRPRQLEITPAGLRVNDTTMPWSSISAIRWRFSPAFKIRNPTVGRYRDLRTRIDTIPTTMVPITPNVLPAIAATDPAWMSEFEVSLPFLSLRADSQSVGKTFAQACSAYGINVELDLPPGPLS